jgi:hypothetical protein
MTKSLLPRLGWGRIINPRHQLSEESDFTAGPNPGTRHHEIEFTLA